MGERYSQYSRLLCPICGSAPRLKCALGREYKAFCSGNGTHISDGDWKPTELEAWQDWTKRRTDKHQPDFAYMSNWDELFAGNTEKFADFLRRVQSGEFQLPEGMTWETWLAYPADGKFPVGYPVD